MSKGYTIDKVWQNISPELGEEIMQFWASSGAIPNREIAEERLPQVFAVGRTPSGELIAISSVYKAFNQILENNLYYLRVFVHEPYRQLEVARELLWCAANFFEDRFMQGLDLDVIGVYLEVESPILQQHRREAVWVNEDYGHPERGFTYIGKDGRGSHLRVFYFKGVSI